MEHPPRMTLSGIVLDAPDARDLATFYRRLLGWIVAQDEPGVGSSSVHREVAQGCHFRPSGPSVGRCGRPPRVISR